MARKITGDPNIPQEQITFRAFPNRPVFPSEEQQGSMDDLEAVESVSPDSVNLEPQRFYLPDDIHCDLDKKLIPSVCLGRFKADTQLADHGYENPEFFSSQLVIFNQDLLGMFIFELDKFKLFERVQVPG